MLNEELPQGHPRIDALRHPHLEGGTQTGDGTAFPADPPAAQMPLRLAADLQDSLLVAANDLERLQRLLADATETLMTHFCTASSQMNQWVSSAQPRVQAQDQLVREVMQHIGGAVTALQFQDMSAQLIDHLLRRLRNCTDRLACNVMGDDDGEAIIAEAPMRPNPVTQDEVDAGLVELF